MNCTSGISLATGLPDVAITLVRQSKWQSFAGKVLVVATGNLSGKILLANYRSAVFLPASHTEFAGKTPFAIQILHGKVLGNSWRPLRNIGKVSSKLGASICSDKLALSLLNAESNSLQASKNCTTCHLDYTMSCALQCP